MKNKMFRLSQIATILCVISCVFLASYVVADVWGRFFSQSQSGVEARVAWFAFDVNDKNNDFTLDISEVNHPGTKKEYTFTVTNNNGAVSEVSEKVSAEITLDGDLPLKITLTDDTTKFIEITSNETTKAEIVSFAAGVIGSKELKLIVEWPNEDGKNGIEFSEKTATVTISLTAEQID